MNICIAQTQSVRGDIARNIRNHETTLGMAAHNTDFVFFPELSLTGYEPDLANQLATIKVNPDWRYFSPFATHNS